MHSLAPKMEVCGIPVESFPLPHGVATSFGFLCADFLYFTDFKSVPQETCDHIKGKINVAIVSAARKILHHSHSSMDESLELMQRLKVKKGFLTHLSHDYDHSVDVQTLPKHYSLAYDGMAVSL